MDLKLKQHRTGRLLLAKQFTAAPVAAELNAASVRFQARNNAQDNEAAKAY